MRKSFVVISIRLVREQWSESYGVWTTGNAKQHSSNILVNLANLLTEQESQYNLRQ